MSPAVTGDPRWQPWLTALEDRYLADLTFPEVSRALRALSSCYVERRAKLTAGAALEGAGKRAAFALFYAPLHALVTQAIVQALDARLPHGCTIVDLGCGTGTAGAAWALEAGARVELLGVDRSAWAAEEARWTWRTLGLHGRAVCADLSRVRLPRRPVAALAAFAVNELPRDTRDALRERLLAIAAGGHAVLVVEPIARGAAPWWREWTERFEPAGARVDMWRFQTPLPSIVARLDHAAGLDHRELTARSIYLAGRR
jgi:SAM-dependent methyltransferase